MPGWKLRTGRLLTAGKRHQPTSLGPGRGGGVCVVVPPGWRWLAAISTQPVGFHDLGRRGRGRCDTVCVNWDAVVHSASSVATPVKVRRWRFGGPQRRCHHTQPTCGATAAAPACRRRAAITWRSHRRDKRHHGVPMSRRHQRPQGPIWPAQGFDHLRDRRLGLPRGGRLTSAMRSRCTCSQAMSARSLAGCSSESQA